MTVTDAPGAPATGVPSPTAIFRAISLPDAAPLPLANKAQRLVSLDVFRGLTIAAMILVNNMGSPAYAMLDHAEWHGWTPTDLIFPFFLFIVGVAIPFSFARRSQSSEQSRGQLLGRVWIRALSLWMLGQLLFAWPMPLGREMPPGFYGVKAIRIFSFVFIYGSVFALLIPWKSKKLQTWIPIAVAVVFYSLMVAMHYVNKSAVANGWDGSFGGGIFNPDRLRIPGVLQRIGLVYGIVGTIAIFAGWRTIVLSIIALCAIYCVLMFKVPYGPGHTKGKLDFEDNFARYVDVAVFDRGGQKHTYSVYPDNEGLVSTIPAIGTCLLGVLLGLWLRQSDRTAADRGVGMLAMGVPVLILGWWLDSWLIPINKILWTPSYMFFTAGLAMLCLGFLFWIIDVRGYKKWSMPAAIFGMNAIAAYVAASIVPRMLNLIKISHGEKTDGLFTYLRQGYSTGMHTACDWMTAHAHLPVIATAKNVSLYQALFLVMVIWVLMAVLYVFKIFVKV